VNVNAVIRPYVICNIPAPYSVEIFGKLSTPFGTLAIQWHSQKMLQRSYQRNPSVGGVKRKRCRQI